MRRGRSVLRLQGAAGIAQVAHLHSEAQAIMPTAVLPDYRKILLTEGVAPNEFGLLGRDRKQCDSLRSRQQGTTGHIWLPRAQILVQSLATNAELPGHLGLCLALLYLRSQKCGLFAGKRFPSTAIDAPLLCQGDTLSLALA